MFSPGYSINMITICIADTNLVFNGVEVETNIKRFRELNKKTGIYYIIMCKIVFVMCYIRYLILYNIKDSKRW